MDVLPSELLGSPAVRGGLAGASAGRAGNPQMAKVSPKFVSGTSIIQLQYIEAKNGVPFALC